MSQPWRSSGPCCWFRPICGRTYKTIHSHPELSHHEEHTSALLAAELRKAGYTVTEHVGKYPDGSQAYGIVAVLDAESTPVTYNDPKLAARVKSALVSALGSGNVFDDDPIMASEDFGVLGLPPHDVPTVMFWLGAMDSVKLASATAEGKYPPGLHTSHFEPVPEATLRTGVTAMTSVAIGLLQQQ